MWQIFTGTRQWDASCYLDWQGSNFIVIFVAFNLDWKGSKFAVIFVAFLRNLGHILQSIDLHGYCIGKRPKLVLKGNHRILLSNTFFVELLSTRVSEKQIEPDLFRSHCFPRLLGNCHSIWPDWCGQTHKYVCKCLNCRFTKILIYESEPRLLLVSAFTY